MHFSALVSKLLPAISVAKRVIKTNPLLPILNNFLFKVKNNELTITASDLQTSIVTTLPVQNVTKKGAIAVPAGMVFSTLNLLPEKESITFSFDNKTYSLTITSTKGQYKLACENAIDFPKVSMPKDKRESIKMPSAILKKAFEQTLFAASQNEERPDLDGVNIVINPKGITFSALGDNQLARYKRTDIKLKNLEPENYQATDLETTISSQSKSLTIPTKSLQLLVQLLPLQTVNLKTEVNMLFDENRACFSQGKTHIITRLVESEFKSYEEMIPSSTPQGIFTVKRETFLKALKMMGIYANKTYRRIKLKLGQPTNFEISALDLNFSNQAQEIHECDYQGQELEIGFDVKLLITIVSKITSPQVTLHFYSAEKPICIVPTHLESQESLLLLLAPMLLTDLEAEF